MAPSNSAEHIDSTAQANPIIPASASSDLLEKEGVDNDILEAIKFLREHITVINIG